MKTHIVLLLDESGSMSGQAQNAINGVNSVINTLKNIKEEITLSLFTMTSTLKEIFTLKNIADVKHIGKKEFSAHGGNEIQCCVYETVEAMDKVLEDKSRVVFITFTDGQECHDNHAYNDESRAEVAKKLVKAMKRKNWTFAYIAPSQYGCKDFAISCGFDASNITVYQTDDAGTRGVFNTMALASERYFEADGNLSKDFFSRVGEKTVMEVNGYKCVINTPLAIKGEEKTNKLPPHYPAMVHKVDEYPACPSNWMHGSAKASSYFVSVDAGRGMWFNLNENNESEYQVAAVISVQGVNPITGQRTDKLCLEQYKTKCPVHDVEFQQDRFCPQCQFKWPAQNYIATTTTPNGQFWLDGFRTEDGKVRQYIFTEEEVRGVAANVIGNDRVFAIGIAFYRSKAKKPQPELNGRGLMRSMGGYSGFSGVSGYAGRRGSAGEMKFSCSVGTATGGSCGGLKTKSARVSTDHLIGCADGLLQSYAAPSASETPTTGIIGSKGSVPIDTHEGSVVMDFGGVVESDNFGYGGHDGPAAYMCAEAPVEEVVATKLEVGAGASIDQKVHTDSESVDFWEAEPIGLIYINYTDSKSVKEILMAGKRDEKKEGFLTAVPVGN